MAGTDPTTGPIPLPSVVADRAAVITSLAPDTELLGEDGGGDRFLVRRGDGRVVRMPWSLYRVAALLDGTRDLAAVAEEVAAQDGRPHTADDVRVAVERRLVPAGLVAPLPGGNDPAPARVPRELDGAVSRRAAAPRISLAAAAVAGVVLVVVTVAVTVLVLGGGAAAATSVALPGPAALPVPAEVTGPPTLLGRVVDVAAVETVLVDVGGRVLPVQVAGLDAGGTPPCAAGPATDFARRTLVGQEVTVVPDPTLPDDPIRRRAYLVLGSQLSYTDAALRAGWATAGEGRYRAGFRAEQDEAARGGVGQWGPPCRAAPAASPPASPPTSPPAPPAQR